MYIGLGLACTTVISNATRSNSILTPFSLKRIGLPALSTCKLHNPCKTKNNAIKIAIRIPVENIKDATNKHTLTITPLKIHNWQILWPKISYKVELKYQQNAAQVTAWMYLAIKTGAGLLVATAISAIKAPIKYLFFKNNHQKIIMGQKRANLLADKPNTVQR